MFVSHSCTPCHICYPFFAFEHLSDCSVFLTLSAFVLFEINIQKCKANFEESGNGEMNSNNVFIFTEDTRFKFVADKGYSSDVLYAWRLFDLHQILQDVLCFLGDFGEDNNPSKKKTHTMYSKKSRNFKKVSKSQTEIVDLLRVQTEQQVQVLQQRKLTDNRALFLDTTSAYTDHLVKFMKMKKQILFITNLKPLLRN